MKSFLSNNHRIRIHPVFRSIRDNFSLVNTTKFREKISHGLSRYRPLRLAIFFFFWVNRARQTREAKKKWIEQNSLRLNQETLQIFKKSCLDWRLIFSIKQALTAKSSRLRIWADRTLWARIVLSFPCFFWLFLLMSCHAVIHTFSALLPAAVPGRKEPEKAKLSYSQGQSNKKTHLAK